MPFDNPDTQIEILHPNAEELDLIDKTFTLLSRKSRWMKNAATDDAGSYCLLGALVTFDGGNLGLGDNLRMKTKAGLRVRRALEKACRPYRSIQEFNDHRRTTHSEVLHKLMEVRLEFQPEIYLGITPGRR